MLTKGLTAYDDLIENDRRRMALLEDAARKPYREWFIRLRFPGHEHTPIHNGLPEGWEWVTLGNLCANVRVIASPDQIDADIPYIGLEHIPRRSISQTDWGRVEDVTSSKHKFSAGDILFGKIRLCFHKVSLAFVDGVASPDAIVLRPNEAAVHSLVLTAVSSDPRKASYDRANAQRQDSTNWWRESGRGSVVVAIGLINSHLEPARTRLEQFFVSYASIGEHGSDCEGCHGCKLGEDGWNG